ncbi:uncharacterized protein [Panulirus ornatus]|uniref:uncharacterized protein n=1 Tax=Panulirus ornatus TaxID=150431 RepID=UPI003A87E3C1
MFLQITISSLCVWVCSARAVPETYGVLEVLEAQPSDMGPYENIVAATIDILPEIADMLVNISKSRSSLDFTDSNSVLEVILAFLPISEKVMEAMAKAEGRTLVPEERERLTRIKEVLPSYFAFMQEIRGTNFYGFANRYGSGFSRGSLFNSGGKSDSYRGASYPNDVRSYPSDGKPDPNSKSDHGDKSAPSDDHSGPKGGRTPEKRTSPFSGSFVKLPIGKSYYISHGGHAQ